MPNLHDMTQPCSPSHHHNGTQRSKINWALAATFAWACAAVTGLTGASSVVSAAPTTLKANTLVIGSDLTYPPFAYMQDGQPAGFDVELMKNLARRLNLAAEFKDTRFASLVTGARAKHFDVIASTLYITPERQRVLNFIPYVKVGSSLLVLESSPYRPTRVEELCGKSVASIKGASWIPKLQAVSTDYCAKNKLGAIQTREFDTDAQATQALRSGAIDVQFMDNLVAGEVLKKFPDTYAVTSRELIYPVLAGIALAPQNKSLFAAIDEAFTQMRASGDYVALAEQYGVGAVSDEDVRAVVAQVR